MWMPTEDELKSSYMHCSYPQRVKDCSLGPQESWGWMQHLAATDTAPDHLGTFQDRRQIFGTLAGLEEPADKDELAGWYHHG